MEGVEYFQPTEKGLLHLFRRHSYELTTMRETPGAVGQPMHGHLDSRHKGF